MPKPIKINSETECWVCHRKAKDLKDLALNYLASGNDPFEKDGWNSIVFMITLGCDTDSSAIRIPICTICFGLLEKIVHTDIEDEMKNGELMTIDDIEKLNVTIEYDNSKKAT